MGNKTIYIKDDELWEKAKRLAGKNEGISKVIADSLHDFVRRQESDAQGLKLQEIGVSVGPDFLGTLVQFYGTKIAETLIGTGPETPEEVAEVYVTKARNFVVIFRDAITNEAHDFEKYTSFEDLAHAQWIGGIPIGERDEFVQTLAKAAGELSTVWID